MLTTVFVSLSAHATEQTNERPPHVLVELFTSEACGECPPAEKYMKGLIDSQAVLPIGLHVSVWDYLGWTDSYATQEFTARQRDYANRDSLQVIYTPQFVVNGRVVGNEFEAVSRAIREAEPLPATLSAIRNGGDLEITVSAREILPESELFIAPLVEQYEISPDGGENAGQSLTFHNTAESLTPVGDWDGEQSAIFSTPAFDGPTAIVLQEKPLGRILGLTKLPGI
ncbi:DUF1223 domain-containing protein [Paracoccaceae bacterium GXU_MW_L88]